MRLSMKNVGKKLLYGLLGLVIVAGGLLLVRSANGEDNSALKGYGAQATIVSLDPPKDLSFAGERVPMNEFEVRERMDLELTKYIYLHSATIMNIKRAARWQPDIAKILRREGIPEDFFYLCVAESHLSNATSPAGAKGFWQFLEATARIYDLEVTEQVDERYDPIKSTEAACKYFKDAYKAFGNWTLVAASYNMGIGGLRKQLERQRVSDYYDLYLNRETSAYVFRILAVKSVLEQPELYGFHLSKAQLYAPLRYKTVSVDTTVNDLVAFALAQGTTYKMVKVLNPWLLSDKLVVPKAKGDEKQKTYRIAISTDGDGTAPQELQPRVPGDSLQADSLLPSPKVGDTEPQPAQDKPSPKPGKKKGKQGK